MLYKFCTVASWLCAFQEFVQGRAPLKGCACGRRTRKIPLSQGFSSCITVHRTVIQFTFFGAPFGMGVSRSAERDDGLCPSTPQAAGAPLEHALFLYSRRLWACARRCFRGFYYVQIFNITSAISQDTLSTPSSCPCQKASASTHKAPSIRPSA